MTNWIQKYAEARCGTKRAFRKPGKADDAARKASLKTGELIISYQCYDCGRWHIGHADEAQVLARKVVHPLCVICGKEIPESRRRRARRSGNTTEVCSSRCVYRKRRRAKQERKREKEQLESKSDDSE